MNDSLDIRFCKELRRLGVDQCRLLAAVSGGIDSMTMLHLLVAALGKDNVQVAHCNFGLRGNEADRETELVQQTCEKLGIICHIAHFDTPKICSETGENIQLAARRLRYDFFNKILLDTKLDRIAVAHNSDDRIETFFINLLRGTGLRGLIGIPECNNLIIRPMMFASRNEIRGYAESEAVVYLNDSSNMETDYLRNKLRLKVLPIFDELSADFRTSMLGNMERLSSHYEFESLMTEEYRRALIIDESIDIECFRSAVGASEFLLYMLLEPYGFSHSVVRDIFDGFEGGVQGKRYFSDGFVALIDRGRLLLRPLAECVETEEELIVKNDERLEWLDISQVQNCKTTGGTVLFDADLLRFPLKLRAWKHGDRFVPFGMTGMKKVSDFLVDAKVALIDKKNVRVLVNDDGEIAWVVGLRTDNRFRITQKTKRVARMKIKLRSN